MIKTVYLKITVIQETISQILLSLQRRFSNMVRKDRTNKEGCLAVLDITAPLNTDQSLPWPTPLQSCSVKYKHFE